MQLNSYMKKHALKSLSKMTPEELMATAELSEVDAVRVAQETWDRSVGVGNVVYLKLSRIPIAASNKDVRRVIFRFLLKKDFNGPSMEIFSNLLSYPVVDDRNEPHLIMSVCREHLSTIAPAIALTAKGTPPEVIRGLAMETGLQGVVLAPKVEIRNRTLDMLDTVLSFGHWEENAFSYDLARMALRGEIRKYNFNEFLKNVSSEAAGSFVVALNEAGTNTQKREAIESGNMNLIKALLKARMDGLWVGSEDFSPLLNKWFLSKEVSPEEKASMANSDNFAGLSEEEKDTVGKILASLPSKITYQVALEMFEAKESDNVKELSDNLANACMFFSRIIDLAKERGVLDKVNQKLLDYEKRLLGGQF